MVRRRTKESVYAWIVALAAGGIMFLTSATLGAYGVLFVEMMDMFQASKTSISLIGSIQTGLSVTGILIGFMVKKLGLQPIGYMAIAMMVVGYLLSGFAESLWVLYITLGILRGLGSAILRVVAAIPIHLYFDERKASALALLTTSFSIGILVWPLLTWWLIQEYTFRGAFLVLSAIQLHGFIFFLIMKDPEIPVAQKIIRTPTADPLCETDCEQLQAPPDQSKHSRVAPLNLEIDTKARIEPKSPGEEQNSYKGDEIGQEMNGDADSRTVGSLPVEAPDHNERSKHSEIDLSLSPTTDGGKAKITTNEPLQETHSTHGLTEDGYSEASPTNKIKAESKTQKDSNEERPGCKPLSNDTSEAFMVSSTPEGTNSETKKETNSSPSVEPTDGNVSPSSGATGVISSISAKVVDIEESPEFNPIKVSSGDLETTNTQKSEISLYKQFGLHLYADPSYALWMLGFSVSYVGSDIVSAYTGPRVVLAGSTEKMAAIIITVYGIVGITSKPVIGVLGDKFKKKRDFLYAFALIVHGALAIISMVSNNYIFLVCYVSISAIFVGMIKTFTYITPVELWRQESSAVVLGHIFCWSGVGSLSGYALIGVLLDHLRDPGQMFAIIGALQVAGGIMTLGAQWMKKRRTSEKIDSKQ